MSTDTKEVEAKWAAHIKSGFESLLSQDEVKNLEAVLGEEGMRRAIESDTTRVPDCIVIFTVDLY